ncbi:MAG: prepilin peptidase [Butyrivibrio sp.]|nr:prepilin peptidase [Butyrivibrio sp.]
MYDLYFRKIPNRLLIAGYAGLLPLICIRLGWGGLGRALAGVLAVGLPLFTVYLIGGIGAGDVKLMGIMGAALGVREGLIYTVLVLFIGAFAGIVKMLADTAVGISRKNKTQGSRTSIRFSIPILIGYLILLVSKGGAV